MNRTSKHYTWKLRDLTQHDRLILRLILSVIHPEDYDHEVAFVNKKGIFPFIFYTRKE